MSSSTPKRQVSTETLTKSLNWPSLLPFDYERDTGAVVTVDHVAALNAFRQSSIPIPADSTKIHGITDGMVARQVIDADHIKAYATQP